MGCVLLINDEQGGIHGFQFEREGDLHRFILKAYFLKTILIGFKKVSVLKKLNINLFFSDSKMGILPLNLPPTIPILMVVVAVVVVLFKHSFIDLTLAFHQ